MFAVVLPLITDREKYMSFHLAAWAATIASASETDVTPVQDGIMAIQNNHFMPQVNTGIPFFSAIGLLIARARLVTPKLRQVTTPFIRPINLALLPVSRQAIADYRIAPLMINGLEELIYDITNSAATSGSYHGVAGLVKGPMVPAPNGDIYTMRGTGTTTVTANAWTQAAMTWQDTLPAGNYQVVGMEFVSTTAIAARFIFEQQIDRPGCVGVATDGTITHPMFLKGGLGAWGMFTGNRFPNVEVLCDSADTAQEVFMDFVRVG
jgi:hypothetical protein